MTNITIHKFSCEEDAVETLKHKSRHACRYCPISYYMFKEMMNTHSHTKVFECIRVWQTRIRNNLTISTIRVTCNNKKAHTVLPMYLQRFGSSHKFCAITDRRDIWWNLRISIVCYFVSISFFLDVWHQGVPPPNTTSDYSSLERTVSSPSFEILSLMKLWPFQLRQPKQRTCMRAPSLPRNI